MRATIGAPSKMMEGTGTARPASIPASVKGWNAIASLANMPPDFAVVMDNFIPRPGYLEVRRGSQSFANDCGTSTTPVQTVMGYNAPNTANSKLFAAANTTIYDITAGATASATSITSLSTSRLQYENFTNSSLTSYLIAANGVDAALIYNGTAWSALSVTGITTSQIIQPKAWKGRLWFCLVNSTQVGYLPVGAISGTAATFDLGPLMSRGGFVNAIATWTVDTKQSVDEYIAFISSQGQVFVYQGTDPSTANTFALVGVYNLGAPIGRRCFLRISGNLWIVTQDGVIPMTEMLNYDQSSAPRVALTATIMNAINSSIQNYAGNFGWQFISYPRGTLAVLNIPTVENNQSLQYVMNTITGAWCRFTWINSNCWELSTTCSTSVATMDGSTSGMSGRVTTLIARTFPSRPRSKRLSITSAQEGGSSGLPRSGRSSIQTARLLQEWDSTSTSAPTGKSRFLPRLAPVGRNGMWRSGISPYGRSIPLWWQIGQRLMG